MVEERGLKMNKKEKKMTPDEVHGLLDFRRRGFKIPAKRGKGSEYNREDFRKATRKEEE